MSFETKLKLQALFFKCSIAVAVIEKSWKSSFCRKMMVWLAGFRSSVGWSPGSSGDTGARCHRVTRPECPRAPSPCCHRRLGKAAQELLCWRFSVLDPSNCLDKVNRRGVVEREMHADVLPSHLVCASVCRFHRSFLRFTNKEGEFYSSSEKEDDRIDFMVFILLSALPFK